MRGARRAHDTPLVSANDELRSRASTIGVTAEVSQRLKRRVTILDKLQCEPGSDSIETVKVTHASYFDGSASDQYADVLSIAST